MVNNNIVGWSKVSSHQLFTKKSDACLTWISTIHLASSPLCQHCSSSDPSIRYFLPCLGSCTKHTLRLLWLNLHAYKCGLYIDLLYLRDHYLPNNTYILESPENGFQLAMNTPLHTQLNNTVTLQLCYFESSGTTVTSIRSSFFFLVYSFLF